jgi:DNA mismatch repair ATPase MutS
MKAFLMHRDRDFDPQQLLTRREKELRYRNANVEAVSLRHVLPWNHEALTQDLGLDILVNAMADDDQFLFDASKVALLSSVTDLDTIRYRQDIFSDCVTNEKTIRDIYQIAIDAIDGERKNYFGSYLMYPGGTLHRAVEILQMFVVLLKRLRSIADQQQEHFESDGFLRLFRMIREELNHEYFEKIEDHLRRLKFHRGVLISAGLTKGNKGHNYVLRKNPDDDLSWFARLMARKPESYSFQLHPRDEGGAKALSALNDRGVNLVANALAQSTDHILSFFQMLRAELAFYIGCLNLHAKLARLGAPTCLPTPERLGERALSCSGLYDISLALSLGQRIIGNDINGDGQSLFIVTGANTGGKSTFLRSIGLAYLMMQAGMFVGADSFASEVCDGVFTHYKREEDTAMESGKWDEELSRMSDIIGRIGPNSLMLFNESFASTNEREGSEIARQIVTALLDSRVKVFFVTHLYHFAQGFVARKSEGCMFLRAERKPDGTRPFKLIEADPLQTSYGEDLYRTIFSAAAE